MRVTIEEASCPDKGEGRRLRRARNAIKRYAGKTEPKLIRRYVKAQAAVLAAVLAKD